jgi:hypothetical protein
MSICHIIEPSDFYSVDLCFLWSKIFEIFIFVYLLVLKAGPQICIPTLFVLSVNRGGPV